MASSFLKLHSVGNACSAKISLQRPNKSVKLIIMLRLQFLWILFLSSDFHHPSTKHIAKAFVVWDHGFCIREHHRHDPRVKMYNERRRCNAFSPHQNAKKVNGTRDFFTRPRKLTRNVMLFDGLTANQNHDQTISEDQEKPILKSSRVTSIQSESSDSTIKRVQTKSDKPEQSVPRASTAAISSPKVNMTSNARTTLLGKMKKRSIEKDTNEMPQPTANGGYTHTKASRAKISAANKGKTPWNKGKSRSPEVRARIAAGVRARNRQVFLKKLEDMGITEEEYEAKKKEEKRIKEAERRARRTENGGYRPTEETKRKISRILKEKHAKGEVKRRAKPDPSKVRRGFTHSEETRRKISESLRKRWQDDEGFQKKMKESFTSREDVRKKISQSLKKKWEDPEFRSGMMDKIKKRKSGKDAMSYDVEHRKKISEAMKRKWQDATYREKTLTSIQKSAQTRRTSSQTLKQKPKPKNSRDRAGIEELKPLEASEVPTRKAKKKVVRKRAPPKKTILNSDNKDTTLVSVRKSKVPASKVKDLTSSSNASGVLPTNGEEAASIGKAKKKINRKKEKDGSVTRLREERRDLFDLLYGDEDDMEGGFEANSGKLLSDSFDGVDLLLGDEDLDSFDPYGLDDY